MLMRGAELLIEQKEVSSPETALYKYNFPSLVKRPHLLLKFNGFY